jgi:hypothetical protein
MSRPQLETASDHLESAADAAADADHADRLADLAEKVASQATADRGPDHGTLARFENALNDLEASASGEAEAAIADAHAALKEYRSGVEGV